MASERSPLMRADRADSKSFYFAQKPRSSSIHQIENELEIPTVERTPSIILPIREGMKRNVIKNAAIIFLILVNNSLFEISKESFSFSDIYTSSETKSFDVLSPQRPESKPGSSGMLSWIGNFFSFGVQVQDPTNKLRKVPVKIEPKVFFANERTYLAWMEMAVTLATISTAIVSFAEANEWSQVYGLMMMPVAICFCIYALYVFMKRAAMIRRKDPGPYEEKTGPIVLGTLLGITIVANFVVKAYSSYYETTSAS
jgi:uncharacterized membrane protein YidH (DUF202 family)